MAQQPYRTLHVSIPPQKHADLPGVRKNVMRFCISGRDNLISHLFWKGDIHQPVPVDVPEFSLAEAELYPSKSVWRHGHVPPPTHDFTNLTLGSSNRHDIYTPLIRCLR